MQQAAKKGRPRAIPPAAYGLVFTLYGQALGYRAIADRLAEMRLCYPTKSSVHRLICGLPPYQGRRVAPDFTSDKRKI